MTQNELTARLELLNVEEQVRWMLALGASLTVAARCAYEVGTERADGRALRGYNEIQHRLFARIQVVRGGKEWTMSSFIGMIFDNAKIYEIEHDVRSAINHSLPTPTN